MYHIRHISQASLEARAGCNLWVHQNVPHCEKNIRSFFHKVETTFDFKNKKQIWMYPNRPRGTPTLNWHPADFL